MVKIAPSILSADFSNLASDVLEVQNAGAELLHIDVMDGHFVPNITLGPVIITCLKDAVSIPFDVHLMIEKPEMYISDFAKSGADMITVHSEATPHLHRTLQQIHDTGLKAGVALNPSTPLSSIEHVLDELEMVCIMTVNPGFGGQSFIHSMLPKIYRLREMLDDLGLNDVEIEIDGGINAETAPLAINAGADILVAGSFVFNGPQSVVENIAAIR